MPVDYDLVDYSTNKLFFKNVTHSLMISDARNSRRKK
jgi:hypothetical protein